jgi:hypothetical protein
VRHAPIAYEGSRMTTADHILLLHQSTHEDRNESLLAFLVHVYRGHVPGTGPTRDRLLNSVPIHAHTTVIPGGEREWVLSAGGRSWRL